MHPVEKSVFENLTKSGFTVLSIQWFSLFVTDFFNDCFLFSWFYIKSLHDFTFFYTVSIHLALCLMFAGCDSARFLNVFTT